LIELIKFIESTSQPSQLNQPFTVTRCPMPYISAFRIPNSDFNSLCLVFPPSRRGVGPEKRTAEQQNIEPQNIEGWIRFAHFVL